MVSKIILIFTLLMTTNLFAKEIVLAEVKNDIEPDVIKIVVDTDDHNELTYLYSDTYKGGTFYQRRSYNLDDIGDGFVIYNTSGRDVVILNSQDFATYAGGEVTMRYLYSGLSGEYRQKKFNIAQTEDAWKITDSRDKTIKGFFFKAKKVFGKVVGIKTIDYRY